MFQQRRNYNSSRQGSDAGDDRREERRAAAVSRAQIMAENREGLGMRVIAVMVQRYGVLPRELWDLNTISDLGAGRAIFYGNQNELSKTTFENIIGNTGYIIVNLTIGEFVSHEVHLPPTLRKLEIRAWNYDYPLHLPDILQELSLCCSKYDQPLVLPKALRKLVLSRNYNSPLTLPPDLIHLELGTAYNTPLILPQRLQRLAFEVHCSFNHPLTLPSSLVDLELNNRYNQPITLPIGIVAIKVGSDFTHELMLPSTLRKIEWCCNVPIQIPEGVSEIDFCSEFNQPVTLPASLKKVMFMVDKYSHPLSFPTDLEELEWHTEDYDGLVLPAGLQKLGCGVACNVDLPLGLRELDLGTDTPFVLPAGLLKVTLDSYCTVDYDLPASVQEVVWSGAAEFSHPSTLHHLILKHSHKVLDLSQHKVQKLTIAHRANRIKQWPQELEELAFTVDCMFYPLRVPKGCRIVGDERPRNVIME